MYVTVLYKPYFLHNIKTLCIMCTLLCFIVEPCIDKSIISSNHLMHIFSKNTLKSHKIHFTPTCFGSHKIHIQGGHLHILTKVLQIHGASPYSRHCGLFVCTVCCVEESTSTQQTAHK